MANLPLLPDTVSTEEAVVAFGASIGVAGFLAQVLASQRLETVTQENIPTEAVAVPIGLSIGSVIAASQFLPGEEPETV